MIDVLVGVYLTFSKFSLQSKSSCGWRLIFFFIAPQDCVCRSLLRHCHTHCWKLKSVDKNVKKCSNEHKPHQECFKKILSQLPIHTVRGSIKIMGRFYIKSLLKELNLWVNCTRIVMLTWWEPLLSLACWLGGGEASPQLCFQCRIGGQMWACARTGHYNTCTHIYVYTELVYTVTNETMAGVYLQNFLKGGDSKWLQHITDKLGGAV